MFQSPLQHVNRENPILDLPLAYSRLRNVSSPKPSQRNDVASTPPPSKPNDAKPSNLKVNLDSISKDEVTVVLPTLNEEDSIGKVIDELKALGYHSILVVDGYSSDKTVEIARSKGVEVVYQKGIGKAGAIRTAIGLVETPYLLVMDADYTYDPRDVESLLRLAGEHDQVIGFRADRGNIPLLHRFGNWVISLVFSLMFGQRILDPCSGMYLLRTETARKLELTSKGFDVEVEIAGQMSSLGRVAEAPIRYRKRRGRSKLRTWREGFNILLALLRVAWLYNPVFLFSALAALLVIPGLGVLLEQLARRYLYGAWSIGWVWLGLTLLVVGLQSLTIATVSLLLKRMERRIIQTMRG